MKKTLTILIATCWLIDLTHAQTTAAIRTGGPASIVGYQIGEPGADSQIWQKVTKTVDAQGGAILQTNQAYVELAPGMNYLKNGRWVPSREEIEILPNGTAAATEGRHQAYFPEDIYQGEIRLVTAEGKQLRSRPVGLSYFDGNNSVLIAELKDSTGWLVGSNQVIYPDAFTDFKTDLRYTYTKAGFEQDIILREQPPTPEFFGLDPETTRLQVLTEFFNPPQPKVLSRRAVTRAGDLSDDLLSFGTMEMGRGRAFLLGANSPRVEVSKQWLQLEGRQFLVEEVPVASLADELDTLPRATIQAGSKTISHPVAKTRVLPPQRVVQTTPKTMFMTKASVPAPGLVLDYQTISGSLNNYTFQGDTTYYINGTVNLGGLTTFEGGAVLKYDRNASLNFPASPYPGQVNCLASAYRPVIFTAKDDNSVGDIISGSTGQPTNYYANPALGFYNPPNLASTYTLSNLRIAWANQAILGTSSTVYLYDAQVVNCLNGISLLYNEAYVRNTLFANVQTNFQLNLSGFDAQNSTFSGSPCLAVCSTAGGFSLTNCILANVTQITNNGTANLGFSGGNNGFYNAPAFGMGQVTSTFYPFQAVGAGNYYLTNGCNFFNQGTTAIDSALLADLQQKTTHPPLLLANQTIANNTILNPQAQRDTNSSPDLGYHYDPIDYLVDNYAITNATLTITNGAAIASYNEAGIQLQDGSAIVSIGSPLYPNWFVRYSSVQEQAVLLGGINLASGLTVSALHYGPVGPTGLYRFSKFACPAGSGVLFNDAGASAYGNLRVQDCELWSGPVNFGGNTNTVTTLQNNLLDRSAFTAANAAATSLSLSNNLVFGTTVFFFNQATPNTWQAFNNDFDSCGIWYNPYTTIGQLANGYNAYLNCSGFNGYMGRLSPTNAFDIVTNATLAYQTGPLGMFYQPPNSPLIHAGSTTADQVGLDQYTVTTYEVVEGSNTVSLGYHYVPVIVPPAITQQPVSVTVTAGGNATFSVGVNALSTPPLSYQWYFNSGVLANATSATLTLTNVQPGHAGNYLVTVTNAGGSVSSSNAVLTVNVPPIITQQPQSQAVIQGTNVTFSVTVSTNSTLPLSYQWYFNSGVLANATNAVLTLTNVQTTNAGNYSVMVGNVANRRVSSSNAVLTVNVPVPPVITQEPTDQTVVVGGTATFTVAADSTLPLTYQWQLDNNPLTDGDGISGSQSSVLTLTNVQTGQTGGYTVVVANTAGSVTSAPPAMLTVNSPPVITQPQSQTVPAGSNVTFSVTATGTAPLSYQWYFNSSVLEDATHATLTLNNVQPSQAGNYSVVVSNSYGLVTSSNASLMVMIWTVDSDYDGVSDAQETVDGTDPFNPNSVSPVRLGYWRFDDTNTWVGDAGQLPLLAANIVGISSWNTNAALIDSTNPAVLSYRDVETNGHANINCRQGTIRFWFKPDWNSVNQGGTGPGSYGRLIEMGNNNPFFTTNSWIVGSTSGWWSLYLGADGNQLVFGSSTNGFGAVNLSANISWVSNQWHQVVLTYTPNNSSLYLDGQLATNGTGSIYYPNATERASGFRIGSDANGTNQAAGAFDELETFNYPLAATDIATNYQTTIQLDTDGNGLPNIWQMNNFGHLGVDPNGDPDGDYLSNLQEYQHGTNPNNPDTDGDGRTDWQEIIDGTDQLNPASYPTWAMVAYQPQITSSLQPQYVQPALGGPNLSAGNINGTPVYWVINGVAGVKYNVFGSPTLVGPWTWAGSVQTVDMNGRTIYYNIIIPGMANYFYILRNQSVVTIAATDPTASEVGPDTGTYTVTRTGGDQSAALIVDYTCGGEAVNGTDYQNLSGNVTIPASQTSPSSATITLTPILNAAGIATKTAVLTLQMDLNHTYALGANYQATVNIIGAYGDTDGDGLADAMEAAFGCDPQTVNSNWKTDSDGDGLPDTYQAMVGLADKPAPGLPTDYSTCPIQ